MLLLAWFFVYVFYRKKIEAYTVNEMRAIEYKIINVKNHNDFLSEVRHSDYYIYFRY